MSIGLASVAFFHLITHALFKSSLFIAAGSLIHLGKGNQDIRIKDLRNFSSSSLILITIPILALRGFPFLAGFFRKERILLTGFSFNKILFLTSTIVAGALLTMLYSIRILVRLTLATVSLKFLSESFLIDKRKAGLLFLSIGGG